MIPFIQKYVFSGLNKNVSAPYVFIILCSYGVVVSAYTGLFFSAEYMIIRAIGSIAMILGFVLLERSPLKHSTLAFWVPVLLFTKIIAGSLYFSGDFLVFTYYIGVALISLTYLRPLGLALYIVVAAVVIAVLLAVFNINLLGFPFTMVHNYLSFMTSVGLNILVYVFGKSYTQTLSEMAKARSDADQAALAKSNFLASMSHEIRTPMNAVTGMTELLLRGDLSDEARGYAQDIKHAAANLLSIINDLLDFSKIEAGKLEIIHAKYLLASLVNDVVSIIRMRLVEKPIRFYTNIDGQIPNSLIGDEVRIRQILINLLANAVKYTDRGHIGLAITQEKRTDDKVRLRITVSDTGYGIKPEDREKLFGNFVRVNVKKNRTIEGTGLGLSIVKRLVAAMGGDISVTSEYGVGSSFTVTIPQDIGSPEPFAAVEEAGRKNVLVFERRVAYTRSICWSLENMNVPHTLVNDLDAFADALFREEWYFVFSGYGLYSKIKPYIDRPDSDFPNGKKPAMALMVEWGIEAYTPNVRFVSIPVQALSIANALNGQADRRDYYEASDTIQYVFPQARILVVDDISTNLRLAQGLLAPYKTVVDICLGGSEAIDLVKEWDYDIIFMDHMMPEMDGIEATAIIREMEKDAGGRGQECGPVPIVALTANAVSGMRELFLEKGFSDFLAKPVDVSKLDEILGQWIPAEKKERNTDTGSAKAAAGPLAGAPLPAIPGIDVAKSIAGTGLTLTGYREVLAMFCKDVGDRLPVLRSVPETETLPMFVNHVHALKSTSASLGAREVSELAAKLEAAGASGDLAFVVENLGPFADRLAGLEKNIAAALEVPGIWETATACENAAHVSAHLPVLRELADALKTRNVTEADLILEELEQEQLDSETRKTLEKTADEVLMAEFDDAVKTIETLIASIDSVATNA